MQEQIIFKHLINGDEISWKSVIFDTVEQQGMDPWNIDIGVIASEFMNLLSTMKDMNLQIPGKVILASAILLKLKSHKFVTSDMTELDKLIATSNQEPVEDMWESDDDDDYQEDISVDGETVPQLVPRTPQPRSRKVSVFDLVKALEKALEVKQRRKVLFKKDGPKIELPNKLFDLSVVIRDVYGRLIDMHEDPGRTEQVSFSHLVESQDKEDLIYTFIPLLHLANMRKLNLHQDQHFGEIRVELLSKQRDISDEVSHALENQPAS